LERGKNHQRQVKKQPHQFTVAHPIHPHVIGDTRTKHRKIDPQHYVGHFSFVTNYNRCHYRYYGVTDPFLHNAIHQSPQREDQQSMQAIGYTGNLHFKEYPLEIPHESLHEYMTPITYYMIHVPRFMECMDKVN